MKDWLAGVLNFRNTNVCIAVGLIVFTLHCSRPSKFVYDMEAFASEICACKDMLCAKNVQSRYFAWMDEHHDARGSQEDLERTQEAMENIAECLQNKSPQI